MTRRNIRELPAYTIAEAAHYLSVPAPTVRYWVNGQDHHPALIQVKDNQPMLLSFLNLVELHILASIRRKHTVPMHKVRIAIEYLRDKTNTKMGRIHPLISEQLETNGLDLFIQRYGELVNISESGQIAIREIMRCRVAPY